MQYDRMEGMSHRIRSRIFKYPISLRVIGISTIVLLLTVTIFLLIMLIRAIYNWNTVRNAYEETLDRKLNAERRAVLLLRDDQYRKNQALESLYESLTAAYRQSSTLFERIIDLRDEGAKTSSLETLYAGVVSDLSRREYGTASTRLTALEASISAVSRELAARQVAGIPADVPESSEPPASGYSRQRVRSDSGLFVVDMIAADLASTRVIVDTAADSDCRDGCPVLPLATYVARNGAFAGVNGTYFCPASYPSCAGKTNSFDLLVMNRNKTYFNSDNNVYSTNPVAIFGNGWVRFEGAASGWGRDTSIDGVISNFPLLLSGGNIVFGGDNDPKKGSAGNRSFVSSKGNTVYIGVVYGVTVAESARALKALGMENAMNLDSGGSTALWSNGYKAGPGRDIPNAVLFVRK